MSDIYIVTPQIQFHRRNSGMLIPSYSNIPWCICGSDWRHPFRIYGMFIHVIEITIMIERLVEHCTNPPPDLYIK